MSGARLLRLMGLGGITLFFASAFSPLPNLLSHWLGVRPQLEPAEAIVVLAGGVYPDGILYGASVRRVVHAVVLYRKALAPFVLLSGPNLETESSSKLARALGLPPEAILPSAEGQETWEEALRAEAPLRERGIRRILLVTDSQHVVRARGLFERRGFEVLASPVDDVSPESRRPGERLALMRLVLKEIFARAYYRLVGRA